MAPETTSRTAADPHTLQRFLDAQAPVYAQVVSELTAGQKRSHWMWFIFPQITGLGSSPTARHFALRNLAEARAYLAHPVLGPRLRECTALVNSVAARSPHRSAESILPYPDDLKFRSSVTLFAQASPDNAVFLEALRLFFNGDPDPATLARL